MSNTEPEGLTVRKFTFYCYSPKEGGLEGDSSRVLGLDGPKVLGVTRVWIDRG